MTRVRNECGLGCATLEPRDRRVSRQGPEPWPDESDAGAVSGKETCLLGVLVLGLVEWAVSGMGKLEMRWLNPALSGSRPGEVCVPPQAEARS